MDSRFVILTTRHRDMFFGGDVHLFWGPESSGYTAVLQTAGLYDFNEAIKIASEDDIPIDISHFEMVASEFGKKIEDIDVLKLYRMTKRSKAFIHRQFVAIEKMKEQLPVS